MELQQLFKSTKAFVFTKNFRLPTEQTDELWVEYINTLSPMLTPSLTIAEIPNSLGRSEKFLNKSQLLSVMSQLGFLETSQKPIKNKQAPAICRFEPIPAPLSVNHIFHKKGMHPFSPGVVRIKAVKVNRLEIHPVNPARVDGMRFEKRLMSTPQPVQSARESRYSKTCLKTVSASKRCSSSTNSIKKTKNFPITQNLQEIEKYSGRSVFGCKEGFDEIIFKSGDSYKGQLKQSKKHGTGCYVWKNFGVKYKGEFLNDKPHGEGKVKFLTGEYFKGSFCEGKLENGFGAVRYQDKGVYDGELVNGKRSGVGKMEYLNGASYSGMWKSDQRSGEGQIEAESFSFQGKFTSDCTDGPGVLIYKQIFNTQSKKQSEENFLNTQSKKQSEEKLLNTQSKKELDKYPEDFINKPEIQTALFSFPSITGLASTSIYYFSISGNVLKTVLDKSAPDGKFVAGRLSGAGIAKYGKYGSFIGTFLNGERSGYGKMIYTDPDHEVSFLGELEGEYIGYFKDDKRHGPGIMTWRNETVYTGGFNQDRRHHVKGKLTLKSGNTYEGTWVENKMEGFFFLNTKTIKAKIQFISGNLHPCAQIWYQDGRVYSGDTKNLTPHGNGSLKWSNSQLFQGHFFEGKIDGTGRMLYENGDIYEGQWENGLRSGRGSFFIHSSGCKFEGEFVDDKRNGEGVLRSFTGEVLFAGFWNNDEPVD